MSPKQIKILSYLSLYDEITLDQVVRLTGQNYYCNARHHTGLVLADMVKRGYIRRVKPGVFTKIPR